LPHSLHTFLLLTGALLLAFAALHDLGFRTVPNGVSAALLLTGLLLRMAEGDLITGLLCSATIFACTIMFWRMGWMGGADVKLLSTTALVVPPAMVLNLVVGTSLAGGVLALIYIVGSRLVPRPASSTGLPPNLFWRALRCERRRLRRRGPLPYAAAIATGGWLALAAS